MLYRKKYYITKNIKEIIASCNKIKKNTVFFPYQNQRGYISPWKITKSYIFAIKREKFTYISRNKYTKGFIFSTDYFLINNIKSKNIYIYIPRYIIYITKWYERRYGVIQTIKERTGNKIKEVLFSLKIKTKEYISNPKNKQTKDVTPPLGTETDIEATGWVV